MGSQVTQSGLMLRRWQGHTGRGCRSFMGSGVESGFFLEAKLGRGWCHGLIFRLVNVISLQFRKVTLAAWVEEWK